MSDIESAWSQPYRELTNRNIGFITPEQQERLRTTKVAVLGMGGIGGTAFEVLVRCGIGRFSIVDRDVFDATNMNRQIFAYRHTLGQRKIDVAAEWAQQINEEVQIDRFDRIDEDNVGEILQDAEVAVMAIDSLGPCIIASRKCRELGIPLVEGWAIPYANVRVFTPETPTLEEVYDLGTEGRAVAEITEEELRQLGLRVFQTLDRINGLRDFYADEVISQIRRGHIVSFAPTVWLTGVLMALEATKALLASGGVALAPAFALYDPFGHQIPTAS